MTLRRARPFWAKKKISNFPISGLIAYYKLEETSGTTAFDSVNSYDGTRYASGTPPYTLSDQTGKIGKCYSFNGQGISIPGFPSLTSGTFNLWVKLTQHQPTVQQNTGFMQINSFGTNQNNHYPWIDGNIYLNIFTSTRKNVGNGIVSDRSQWHMVTITADSGSNVWKFYQNATLVTTSTVGTITILNPMYLGWSGSFFTMNGALLDEISFHDRALSQAEIDILYNSGNGTTI